MQHWFWLLTKLNTIRIGIINFETWNETWSHRHHYHHHHHHPSCICPTCDLFVLSPFTHQLTPHTLQIDASKHVHCHSWAIIFFCAHATKFFSYLLEIPLWPCAAYLSGSLSGFFLPAALLPCVTLSHSWEYLHLLPITANGCLNFTRLLPYSLLLYFQSFCIHTFTAHCFHLIFPSMLMLSTRGDAFLPVQTTAGHEDIHLHVHKL